ncbi:GNAT superfamily N-acetyltransferase [Pseudonocardia eucalypti]|uniref:GNAT family N-acetyltransferase n=1 Tax=Pseudonocardia eucalypti TaxID=648755 RepID=UPI0017A22276|nr:GNAT superfamily N-acetyltransferase [Pseudonocardia eucalypti]
MSDLYGQSHTNHSRVPVLGDELATLWDVDPRGRVLGDAHHLVVAAGPEGLLGKIGAHLPEKLAEALTGLLPGAVNAEDVLVRARALLAAGLGPVAVSSGPSYLVPPGVEYPSPTKPVRSDRGETRLVRSDGGEADAVRAARPVGWTPGEWVGLLAGRHGPWAMAVEGDEVVAICHTPVSAPVGAEAGVWTHPGHRGRGLAAAVTAGWAAAFPDATRRLFYSTDRANRSSQRVAARLGLRHIGDIWKLSVPGREDQHAHRPWITSADS